MCYTNHVRREADMRSYSRQKVIKALKDDGWYLVNVVSGHNQFKHPHHGAGDG